MEAVKLLVKNKKAYADYEILETYETGIILTGAEVKSIKGGHAQLKGSFAAITGGRVWLEHMHVSPYPYSVQLGYEPARRRELLLHKKEIVELATQANEKGMTIVPLQIYLKKGLIKVQIGVCRGKKKHDKRDDLKQRAMNREINQSLKAFSR